MDITLFASLAGNALLAIAALILAAKLAEERLARIKAEDLVTLRDGVINAMRSDATLGRKTRLQRDAALRKAMAVNSARKAEKAALANAVN